MKDGTAHCTPWESMFRADEVNLAYFAERAELPGVTLFCAERDDAPEFDVALIYRVPATDADDTLRAITDYFRRRHRHPRVRVSPHSAPLDWPRRLVRAGFVESDESFRYFSVPATLHLTPNPAVRVARANSAEDGDRFSAIQIAGFDIPVEHRGWDRSLVHRHMAAGQHTFYLAWLDGQAVGAARCIHLPGMMTAMAALATMPDARGQGIGTTLLARMIDDARKTGSRLIFGAVIPSSYAARLYERLGFVSHFATSTFVEAGVPAIRGQPDGG